MVLRIGTWLGTAASLAGLIYVLLPADQKISATQGGLIALVGAGFVILIILDVRAFLHSRPYAFRKSNEINNYMYNWISRGGRVVIFTRDMSWANEDARIRELLHTKAQRDELSICLPEPIPLTEELQQAGAEILSYEHLNHIPQSRFTIINKDRMDAQVAVGRWIDDRLIIEEFALGQHPVFSVANDLVEIVRSAACNTEPRSG